MQVSTHDQDTPAANKQHKIEDQLPEYFNHGRILAPLAGIIPDLSFNLVGHHGHFYMIMNLNKFDRLCRLLSIFRPGQDAKLIVFFFSK